MTLFSTITTAVPDDYRELNYRAAIDLVKTATEDALAAFESAERGHKSRVSVLREIEKRRRHLGSVEVESDFDAIVEDAELDELIEEAEDEGFDDVPHLEPEKRANLGALTLVEVAELQGVELEDVQAEYERGYLLELERTGDDTAASAAARRNLSKKWNYYSLVAPESSEVERIVFSQMARPKLKTIVEVRGTYMRDPLKFMNHYSDDEFLERVTEDASEWIADGIIPKSAKMVEIKLVVVTHSGGHPLVTENTTKRSKFVPKLAKMAFDLYNRYAFNRSNDDPFFMGEQSEEDGEESIGIRGIMEGGQVLAGKFGMAFQSIGEYRASVRSQGRNTVNVQEYMMLPEVMEIIDKDSSDAIRVFSPKLASIVDEVRGYLEMDEEEDDDYDDDEG